MIGVKPLFSGSSLNDQDTAKFEVAMVAPDGKQIAATGLKWQLLSIESKYQWYRSKGYWSYEPIKVTRRVADGTLDLVPDKPGKIAVPVSWGRYRLEVTSPDPTRARDHYTASTRASMPTPRPTRRTCSRSLSTRRSISRATP